MTETSTDPIVAELKRVGDAIFATKNAVVANTAMLEKLVSLGRSSPDEIISPAPATPASALPVPSSTPLSAVIVGGQAVIEVGPTRAITEPADALQYLAPGGTILLDDASYLKPFHNTVPGLTIKSGSGLPRRCYFDGQRGHGGGHDMAWHKGMIHSSLPITVTRVGFLRCGGIGSTDVYSNEAAIWLGDSTNTGPWTATITECTFDDCANGIFTADEPGLVLVSTGNVFGFVAPNGMNASAAALGPHAAHDIYSSAGENDVTGNFFYGSVGHNVKTRSSKTTVRDNPLMCQDGGRVLDACEGGAVIFAGNKVWTRTDRQGQAVGQNTGAFGNSNLFGYALENGNHGTAGAQLSGNVFNITRPNSTVAAGSGGVITSAGDSIVAFGSGSLVTQGAVFGLPACMPSPAAGPALPSPPAWAA